MVFVTTRLDNHEWCHEFEDGATPLVGDTIELWHRLPDSYEDADFVEGVVIGRRWQMPIGDEEDIELILRVTAIEPIPEGHVADCDIWPATEWSERRHHLQEQLEQIRSLSFDAASEALVDG